MICIVFWKKMNKLTISVIIMMISKTNCSQDDIDKSKEIAHHFRKQVEEIEDKVYSESKRDNLHGNLVQFLIKNVKEIFNNIDTTDTTTDMLMKLTTTTYLYRPPMTSTSIILVDSVIGHTDNDVMVYENLTRTTLIDNSGATNSERNRNTKKDELLHLTKDLKHFSETDEKTIVQSELPPQSVRSCIACDNVRIADCVDPGNKLIPSVFCEHANDLCYSLHTPFGIIERGCFNVNRNLTTYVCSCNLCNYISISDMPRIFASKQDWVDNIIELSRMRHLKRSVHKEMNCLKCEVNTTSKVGDMLDSANCLEGNVGNLPSETCTEDEVCAVRAVKNDGYVWRGCTKFPLYNYWWALCDSDLCNYDILTSIYDVLL